MFRDGEQGIVKEPPQSRRERLIAFADALGQRLATGRDPRIGFVAAVGAIVVLTATLAPVQDAVGLLNVGLLYLLLTLLVASTWGWQIGLFSAILCNLALNFFFVEPLHKLTVQNPANAFGLFVFLIVSVVGGSLLSATRRAVQEAKRREAEATVLLELSRVMIGQTDPTKALAALCRQADIAFGSPGASVLRLEDRQWSVLAAAGSDAATREPDGDERAAAYHAMSTGTPMFFGEFGARKTQRPRIVAPIGLGRLGGAGAEARHGSAFVPLLLGERPLGVLRVDGPIGEPLLRRHPERLLAAFAREAALAVERVHLAGEASHAEALRQADEMKSALMASISHDLNTPLAGIKASVSSLLDASVEWSLEDRQAFLETIDSQSDRLSRVIGDILNLNRIEAGAVNPMLQPVEVRDVLEEAKERTASVTAGRAMSTESPEGLMALTDASLTVQALVNLVENAAKYSTPGGAIRLRAARAASKVEISVEDDGPGIAPEDLPHVFDRFYRAGELSRRVKGSGLGLAIVKAFAGLCGGSVRVESSPAGTRFTITLPGVASAERGR